MALSDYLRSMTAEGINIALDSLQETTVEITTAKLAQKLNEMKWAGKGNWTDEFIESYLDNLRSNLQSSIQANIIQRRIAGLQIKNFGIAILNKSTLTGMFNRARGRGVA